jgi:5'(3')-deoxyribonucleotidase
MKEKTTLLIDLDCITVNMLPPWIKKYNELTGETIKLEDVKEYDISLVCTNEEVLYSILSEPDFFYNMEEMPNATKYLKKLIDDGYNVIIVTQPPRIAEFAVRDKRRWILKHIPDFDLTNMIFCHKKEMIKGDLIFDDKPSHLKNWKETNPNGVTATLDWQFTKVKTHFTGSLENGWAEFYEFVHQVFPI